MTDIEGPLSSKRRLVAFLGDKEFASVTIEAPDREAYGAISMHQINLWAKEAWWIPEIRFRLEDIQ